MKNVATEAKSAPRRKAHRVELSLAQLRTKLTIEVFPIPDESGKVKWVKNPSRDAQDRPKPYRILLDGREAPVGFGLYVGTNGPRYEMTKRGRHGVRRFSLGSVFDMGLDQAFEEARRSIDVVKKTGDNPKKVERLLARQEELRTYTVGDCMREYITFLQRRVNSEENKLKQVSVTAVENSLSRLERKEVDIANKVVRDLDDTDVLGKVKDGKIEKVPFFEKVRKSAMTRSNRIPKDMKAKLEDHKDWAKLSTSELEAMGITGKYVQRVRAAGQAAAEHTLTDAIRAVDRVINLEQERAQKEQREPVLFFNPLRKLYEEKVFRSAAGLRKHYERAQVRNPLGDDDNTLARVLKTIVARRDEQGGMNRTGADYLLLILLFGCRRGEAARLKWFDKCSKSELAQNEASWVWLAGAEDVNPITKRKGSQVYFHDTKNGDELFLPVGYFGERILRQRMDERDALEEEIPGLIREAQIAEKEVIKKTIDTIKLAKARRKVELEQSKLDRLQWVFPARSYKARSGHYSDSKSIIRNVRRDSGLLNLDEEIDIGLTPHDFRRTMGRYANELLKGSMVSKLLHHKKKGKNDEEMENVTRRYAEPEWIKLRDAYGAVEEAMIATSPRVWNRLKGIDKPRLDEVNDPPAEIFLNRKAALE